VSKPLVYAVTMVRDEADVVAATVGHMLTQVDRVIVADNGSTDGTRDILADLDVTVIDDPEVGYFQSRKMSALAEDAREMGAAWVVPFDADEIWTSPFGTVGDALRDVPSDWLTAAAELHDHVATGLDPAGDDPVARMTWRRTNPAPLPKTAARCLDGLVIEQGNHGANYGFRPALITGRLQVHHYPYRSAEQFVRKARNGAQAYAATDLPEDAGAHWRGYGRILDHEGEEACADIFRTWFWQPDSRDLIQCP
jgi:glycosyltransferase involved in cell wall biosynthesis